MRAAVLAMALVLGLGGCAAFVPPSGEELAQRGWDPAGLVAFHASAARPVVPTEDLDTVAVTWRRVTPAHLARIEAMVSPFMRLGVHGVALLDVENRTCTVYAVVPTHDMTPELAIFGHEVLHCFLGAFHGAAGLPAPADVRALRDRIDRDLGFS